VLVRGVSRDEVVQLLEQHLTGNLLREGGSFFLQTTGKLHVKGVKDGACCCP
jgi:hypothetical protein